MSHGPRCPFDRGFCRNVETEVHGGLAASLGLVPRVVVGRVTSGATTPWSWASLPGFDYTGVYFRGGKWWRGVLFGYWLVSERRPEGRKP